MEGKTRGMREEKPPPLVQGKRKPKLANQKRENEEKKSMRGGI